MSSFTASFIATIVTVPLLGYIIVFVFCKQIIKDHRRSVFFAVDVTTLLLLIAVHFLIVTIWSKSFLPLILIVLLTVAIIYAIYYWRTNDEMNVGLILRSFWRIAFVIGLFTYLILFIIGIVKKII